MSVPSAASGALPTGNDTDQCHGHIVQFYLGDDELVADVVAHLATALESGGSAVAIATPAHRSAFAMGLAELEIEPGSLERLVLIDAEETLQRFLVDDELDTERFNEVVGGLVRNTGSPVHAYGEMVAILWQMGRIQDAIDLEVLWNSLGERYPFVLLCGYPDESCLWDEQATELARVCELHGAVTGSAVPPATPSGGGSDDKRILHLPRENAAVRLARVLVRDVFTEFSIAECERAELLVSELVTNALEHGTGEVVVQVAVEDRSVFISVSDADPTEPVRKTVPASSPRGRGMQIVESLSVAWGVRPSPDHGKTVWAELLRTAR